ncbi:MAG: ISKra4 family transposase, partial [Solirubrobacterales bacterium]
MGHRPSPDPPGGLARGGPKRGLQTSLAAEVAQEIEALVAPGAGAGLDFEAVEVAVRRRALQLAARLIERRLNADTSDHTGPEQPCGCGAAAHYAGRRAKRFTTVLGDLTLERAYYHCTACGTGVCPRDRALGVEATSLSPGVTRMVGLVGALVSFAEGSELLGALAGVTVPPKHVERAAEALGREIAEDERRVVEPGPPAEVAPTLYLGMDGTGIPMRAAELAGRAGKQPDGTAKTREVKLCTIWSAEARDEAGAPVRDPGSVSYSAAIESAATRDTDDQPSAFAGRVVREAHRRGFDRARRRVVLGDGAPWIWNLADEQCPDALQIVDRFHAKEHLSDVAKLLYGPTSDLAQAWAHKRHVELEAGDLDTLLRALRTHASANDEARKCIDYIERNRQRMRYPEFRAQGLCTSTGVVEAGCKVAIGTRLKRAGMHWTIAGANAIIALRCAKLSGRFEAFWERR